MTFFTMIVKFITRIAAELEERASSNIIWIYGKVGKLDSPLFTIMHCT